MEYEQDFMPERHGRVWKNPDEPLAHAKTTASALGDLRSPPSKTLLALFLNRLLGYLGSVQLCDAIVTR
jgi:hypothetical protein